MTKSDSMSASTVTGTGEFVRKGQHVIAALEIRSGMIHSLGFTNADGTIPIGSEEMVRLLLGRSVTEALELNPKTLEKEPTGVYEVLFEAFHRAVETCLDPQ